MSDQLPKNKSPIVDAMDRRPDAQRERVAQIAREVKDRQSAPAMKLKLEGDVLKIVLGGESLEIGMLLQMVPIFTPQTVECALVLMQDVPTQLPTMFH